MRNLSNAQRKALEVGRAFIDEMHEVVETNNSEGINLNAKCEEFAKNARNGKAATSALCAYIDTQAFVLDKVLTDAADVIHLITKAPYGSIHKAFDDPQYMKLVSLLVKSIVELEMLANEVSICAAEKFEEATE